MIRFKLREGKTKGGMSTIKIDHIPPRPSSPPPSQTPRKIFNSDIFDANTRKNLEDMGLLGNGRLKPKPMECIRIKDGEVPK